MREGKLAIIIGERGIIYRVPGNVDPVVAVNRLCASACNSTTTNTLLCDVVTLITRVLPGAFVLGKVPTVVPSSSTVPNGLYTLHTLLVMQELGLNIYMYIVGIDFASSVCLGVSL